MAGAVGDETSYSVEDFEQEDDTTGSEVWTDGNTSSKVDESGEGKGPLSKVEEGDEDRREETGNQEKPQECSFASEISLGNAEGGERDEDDLSKVSSNNIDEILEKIERVNKVGEALERAFEDSSLNESMLLSVLEKAVQGSNLNMDDLRTLPGPSSKREEDEEQAKIDELLADLSSGNKNTPAPPPRMDLDQVLLEYDQLEKSLLDNESDVQDEDHDLSVASISSSLTRSLGAQVSKSQKYFQPSTKVSQKPIRNSMPLTSSIGRIGPVPVPVEPVKKSIPTIPTTNLDDRPLPVRSSQSSPVISSSSKKSPSKVFRRDSLTKTGFDNDTKEPSDEEIFKEKIAHLEKEVERQDNLIVAFQEDNASLCKQLKDKQVEWKSRVEELEDLVGSLKTEIATLKIARLSGGSPGRRPTSADSAKLQKEVDRLKVESESKSINIQDLRKEVVQLQNKLNEALKRPKGDEERAKLAVEEKNRLIVQLERRVRTLQKILYTKNGAGEGLPSALVNSPMAVFSAEKLAAAVGVMGGKGQVDVILQRRVEDLEKALEAADEESRSKLQEFNAKLHALKGKYEDQLDETESKLAESERRLRILEDSSTFEKTQSELRSRLEKTQAEVLHWRQENMKLKRDLELRDKSLAAAEKKTVVCATTATQGDAGTLALALKSFRREMAEKDKELLKLKKEVNEFKKTNANLKKEREKLLLLQHGLTSGNMNAFGGPALRKSTVPPAELQSVLEKEREEYGRLLDAKGAEVEKKAEEIGRLERLIRELQSRQPSEYISRQQVQTGSTSPSLESQIMIDQLQRRLEAQNTLIVRMRDHLKNFQEMDLQALKGENIRLREEVKDLRKRLEIADALKRPEHEVLDVLSRKLELLEGRYLEREKTLENLLRRAACKVTVGGGSSNSGRSQWGDICELSPTTMSLTLLSSGD